MTKQALRAKLLQAAERLDQRSDFSCLIVGRYAGVDEREDYSKLFEPENYSDYGSWVFSEHGERLSFEEKASLRVLMVLLFREMVSK